MRGRGPAALWLRWAMRDFRLRWLQLTATALVIAIGTGAYAGLSSVSRWRELSNDASFEQTAFHDLRVQLGTGNYVEAGTLLSALGDEPPAGIEVAVERLVVPTLVETSGPGGTILIPGRIVGAPVGDGAVAVDRLHIDRGRALAAGDAGAPVALFERNFGKHYDLPAEGELSLAGGSTLRYVGQAISPEYFLVVTEAATPWAEANFAVVFTSIETAQQASGLTNSVNDLVIRLSPDADRAAVAAELEKRFEPLGGTVLTRDDEDAYRVLVEDAKTDQEIYTVFAFAILAGAVFAAFNIISRMVEAQRREFGIAMALGVPAWKIALRPLLVGLQIALMGVGFGVAVGMLVGWLMGEVLRDFLTMPVLRTPFQTEIFIRVALLGLLAPLLAIAYPVWRAVTVPPIQAIRTGHLAVRTPGLARVVRLVPIPGNTFTRLPFRNLARAPRRAILTSLGIAAIVGVLSSLLGYMDSFWEALDRAEREAGQAHPERMQIEFDRFYPTDSETAQRVLASPELRAAEGRLRLAAALSAGGEPVEVLVELVDFGSATWRPTAAEGTVAPGPGVVLSESMARELGVGVGDEVSVTHLKRQADGSFVVTQSALWVRAIHPHPLGFQAYMDISQAAVFGLENMVNAVSALPGPEGSEAARRAMFDVSGVVSVQEVTAGARTLRDRLSGFIGIFRVMEALLVLLAALIAFNTASINAEERRREHATMLAFGTPPGVLVATAVVEGALLGLVATAMGLALGRAMEQWFIYELSPRVLPNIGLRVVLDRESVATALFLGVVTVALTPVAGWRRLARMDVPAMLKTME